MNLYEKLALARKEFKDAGIKQSGKNDFAKYTYFDLTDILPATTELEAKHKMLSVVSFDKEIATLTLINCEEPSEQIKFTSPMSTATLKGCHEVQNLGAVETYVRRYLYLIAYEIVETEALDKTQGKDDKKPKQEQKYHCDICEKEISEDLFLKSKKKYGFSCCCEECRDEGLAIKNDRT